MMKRISALTFFFALLIFFVSTASVQKNKVIFDCGFTVIDESRSSNNGIGVTIDKEEFLGRPMDLYLSQNFNRFDEMRKGKEQVYGR